MRIGEVAKIFGGSVVVYVVMAACASSSDSGSSASSSGGASSAGGMTSGGGSTSSSGSSGPVPNAMADEYYKPGSRLKLRYYEGDDGMRQFAGWYDSARMENCSISKHADGQQRCLPVFEQGGVANLFADAGCSQQPLTYRGKSSAPPPKYGLGATTDGGVKVFSRGSTFTGTVYQGTPSACTAYPPASNIYDLYETGAEVLGSSFVLVTAKTSP